MATRKERRLARGGSRFVAVGAPLLVGRVRTAAHAFTLNRMAMLATVPPEIAIGTSVSVDVLGEPVDASVAPDVLYDPHDERIRD